MSTSNASGPLTPERILEAAEETLRRFGPAKTTVVDVARALGVSHGSVYRHFPTKADLRDAVVDRWLQRMHPALSAVAQGEGAAAERVRLVLWTLAEMKWTQSQNDPEFFTAFAELAEEARTPVVAHVDFVVAQLTKVIAEGVARGEIASADSRATALAVFDATAKFHNPAARSEWVRPAIDEAFANVWTLLRDGLLPRPPAV
ncbi:TetR family transcriptional regulator [Catenulispora pinisilvae]|uniref:TetR family transcriptional regulator n=1 Tax=Catenulispora pinisilvae TaxID=2705253 RepID=UPI00189171A0|nr:TetR family transcriptional regulator [Catenulispora pinisilvae]